MFLEIRSGLSPATPDIGRKPARPAQTGEDGSSCSPLSGDAAAVGLDKVGSDGVDSVPLPTVEQNTTEKGEAAGYAASTTQELHVLPQMRESTDGIAQQDVANANSANAANVTPIPTPQKVEPSPRRWRKRSTKGRVRFKVMKDKWRKAAVTPKQATPSKVRKKRKAEGHGDGPVPISGIKSVRRKLDFGGEMPATCPSSLVESSASNAACFSRAMLMDNMRCLAKNHGLSDDLSAGRRIKKGKKRKTRMVKHQDCDILALVHYQNTQTDASSLALVPGCGVTQLAIVPHGNHGKRLRTKVLGLDEKTIQVYNVLREWDERDSESFEGLDIGSGPEWEESRRCFELFADEFIATLHDLVGPRKFSQWGGSVIDSVVGTFLTQNVADNLSSDAFMNLVAKFPPSKRCSNAEECSSLPLLIDGGKENLNLNETTDAADSIDKEGSGNDEEVQGASDIKGDDKRIIENFIATMQQEDLSKLDNDHLMDMLKNKRGIPVYSEITIKKFIATQKVKDTSHWDNLRTEAYRNGYEDKNSIETSDSVDWEAVLHAPITEVADHIAVRGQHYLMATRIQAFLKRVKEDHGSIDLEWLRHVSRASAKNYLLSILGLGDKSVDCIRLLSLRHKAFPVDTNVARIVTRLGWVQLQSLPSSAEFHSVELYPIMADVQRYLWPRLCTIKKEKLYELHCLMITFGKIICTKVNPNCSACPFSAKCKYYNSSHGRMALPSGKHEQEHGLEQTSMVDDRRHILSNSIDPSSFQLMHQHQIKISRTAERHMMHNNEPIIEMPPSPQHDYAEAPCEQDLYEDVLCGDLEDIVPQEVQYDVEIDLCSTKLMTDNGSWRPDYGKDLVLTNSRCTAQNRKLKNIARLRTEYNAYVLPDDHPILEKEKFDRRVPEDPCPYLLIIISCPDEYTVNGAILIPCRTATRGRFPLNGTYFQEHEVFADHSSSRSPLTIPRECIWNLERRTVYFGSSIHSITKGQSKQGIEDCFKKGYICVRAFDRKTRCPRRLCPTLHVNNETKEGGKTPRKRAKTSPGEGGIHEKASPANWKYVT